MCKIGTNEQKKSEIKLYGVLFNFGPALNAMNCQNYDRDGRRMGCKKNCERSNSATTNILTNYRSQNKNEEVQQSQWIKHEEFRTRLKGRSG